MPDTKMCVSDCGCAGGQPSATCEFEPGCSRCISQATIIGHVAPWVARNLDRAQYMEPRGSQYAGQDRWEDWDEDLVPYLVTLESGQMYRFWSENADHAREQAENAEPDNPVTHVEKEPDGADLDACTDRCWPAVGWSPVDREPFPWHIAATILFILALAVTILIARS